MSFSIISFTGKGMVLAEQIAGAWQEDVCVYTKCSDARQGGSEGANSEERISQSGGKTGSINYVDTSVGDWAGEQMNRKSALLFIGACGIAVRAIAPHLTDKLHDSPVLVMDEAGQYVIPILSGHMGGANELALQISQLTGAVPVITTATDVNHKFSVDLFAKKNGLQIMNKDGIAKVSAKVLAGEELTMSMGQPEGPVDILIAAEKGEAETLIWLKPKEYVIGMGCRKGKDAEEIEKFIARTLREQGILQERVWRLASIDVKMEEPGLLAWSRKYNVSFVTYTAEELTAVPGFFEGSVFVKEQVGVDNVCERAALKACEPSGELIYKKHGEDGMTIAIAKCTNREWRLEVDGEDF